MFGRLPRLYCSYFCKYSAAVTTSKFKTTSISTDKICVLTPAFGVLRRIGKFILDRFFGAIGKIFSFIAALLIFAVIFALRITSKDA